MDWKLLGKFGLVWLVLWGTLYAGYLALTDAPLFVDVVVGALLGLAVGQIVDQFVGEEQ